MHLFVDRNTRRIESIGTVPDGQSKADFDVYDVSDDEDLVLGDLYGDAPDETKTDDTVDEVIKADHDLSPLDLNIGKLTDALQDIDDVMYLLNLLEAEHDGKTRKGALAAINDRLCELGVED